MDDLHIIVPRQVISKFKSAFLLTLGAENETRTRDPNLGKVMLYQLSYFRNLFTFLHYFKEQSVSFPFCECKGTAFF